MSFKLKALSAAVVGLGFVSGAQAAFLNENNGTGQFLIYPYYTVQNGTDTLVTVTNTTNRAKAVKVRFIEGKNSREVLDFNLYLSPYDVWTGVVTADADSGGAKIKTTDTSCTAPLIPANGQPFRNSLFSSGPTTAGQNGNGNSATGDVLENAITRVREGYIEIIEMGVTQNVLTLPSITITSPVTPLTLEQAVTHMLSTGKPADCALVNAAWTQWGGSDAPVPAGMWLSVTQMTGGLTGTGTLINVNEGTDYSYDAVAVDDFNSSTTGLHHRPGTIFPNVTQADASSSVITRGLSSIVGAGTGRRVVSSTFAPVLGAATALQRTWAFDSVLMRSAVINEYIVDPSINAATDWVVTFPTKYYHIGEEAVSVSRPFTLSWDTNGVANNWTENAGVPNATTWNACEPVQLNYWNREEVPNQGTIDFSPSTPQSVCLPWEANVITFSGSSSATVSESQKVLKSANLWRGMPSFSSGWARIGLDIGATTTTGHSIAATTTSGQTIPSVYYGLPVVGFAVQRYTNGNVGGALSNYGGNYIHKYETRIECTDANVDGLCD